MTDRTPLELLRLDRAVLEAELLAAGSNRRGNAWHCPNPNHPDKNPSAGVYKGDRGVWRVKCHGCGWNGDVFDVRALTSGMPLAQVLQSARHTGLPRQKPAKATERPPAAHDTKHMPNVALIAQTQQEAITGLNRETLASRLGVSADTLSRLRLGWCESARAFGFPMVDDGGRVVGIRLRNLEGRKWSVKGGHEGLFIPEGLTGSGPLVIAEGPTDTAAALDLGLDAIGRANNSSRTAEQYIDRWLRGQAYREVWIITDNDTAGSRARDATVSAAHRLAQRLAGIVPAVRVFQPPDPHKDLRDWRRAGATVDDVQAAADQSEPVGPAADLRRMLEDEITGKRYAVGWPWRLVERGTQALLPGTVTLLVGDPGSGKSLMLLEALAYWHDAGLPLACFMLEQDHRYHLRRALAQRTGCAWLTNLNQLPKRGDDALALSREQEGWLIMFGRCIEAAPTGMVSLADLKQWIIRKAEMGKRVICIDPITAADDGDKPWHEAKDFLATVLPVLEDHGASLVLVSHPRKGKQRGTVVTMDDLAGGAAWVRFSHTILWLERYDEPRGVTVRRHGDPLPEAHEVQRTLRIMKARNGNGTGWQLAVEMDPAALRFTEIGAIVKTNQTHGALE